MRRLILDDPPITPRSIPGCVLWMEADRIPQRNYASDTFTRADSASSLGTADDGVAWNAGNATDTSLPVYGIASNQAYPVTSSGTDVHAWRECGAADGVISCDVTVSTAASSGIDGVLFRRQDSTNYFAVRLSNSGDTIAILRNLAGSRSTIASTGLTLADAQTVTVKVVLSGSTIAVYADGVLKITTTDANLTTATKHGIYGGTTGGAARWDNFSVRLNNDGDPLNSWSDLSGFGNHATQTTPTNQPVVKTGIVNGRPVVRFASASSQYLKADTIAAALGGSDVPFTVVWVGRLADTPGSNYAWFGLGRSSTANPLHYGLSNGSGLLLGQRRDDAATSKSTTATGTLDTAAHVFAHVFRGTTLDQLVDGVGSTGNDLDVSTITFDQFALGALNRTTAANFLNGDIAFMGLWNRALSAGELSRLNRKYLAGKYGIAAT